MEPMGTHKLVEVTAPRGLRKQVRFTAQVSGLRLLDLVRVKIGAEGSGGNGLVVIV